MKARAGLGVFLFVGVIGAAMFLAAGRSDLPFFWAYLGALIAVMTLALAVADPDLMKERMQPGPGGKDRYIRLKMVPLLLAHYIVAGLDAGRYHWSAGFPRPLQYAGLAGVVAAFSLVLWATRVNRFFSPVVRLQTDRGHHLITSGPYAFIRHPGYAGSFLWLLSSGLALGSWYSFLPAAGGAAVILYRLQLEDKFLHEMLPGYAEYAQRVRARVLPRVW
jgi:protein-S-isoprenylcysteine O-methyltransferase Ste14